MEVILTQNVDKLGRKGEIRNVKPGYYMNYLCPKGLAIQATAPRLKWAEKMKEARVKEHEEILKNAQKTKEQLESTVITLSEKTTEKGTLYGSIGDKEIQKAIEEQIKIKLDKKQIDLPEAIKSVGKHTVKVQLTEDVLVDVSVEISEKKS